MQEGRSNLSRNTTTKTKISQKTTKTTKTQTQVSHEAYARALMIFLEAVKAHPNHRWIASPGVISSFSCPEAVADTPPEPCRAIVFTPRFPPVVAASPSMLVICGRVRPGESVNKQSVSKESVSKQSVSKQSVSKESVNTNSVKKIRSTKIRSAKSRSTNSRSTKSQSTKSQSTKNWSTKSR